MKQFIAERIVKAVKEIYNEEIEFPPIQKTKQEFKGDYTIVVFPLLRLSKKSPEQTALELGEYLKKNVDEIQDYNVIKGFLNLSFSSRFWIGVLNKILRDNHFGVILSNSAPQRIMIEYSSPNTNKPLHLGHIRNNILGYSIAQILKANGHEVIKVNLVNDRGIHICKSMLAWLRFGNNETPESTGLKGDHLVGKYYVRFDQEYKKEIAELVNKGMEQNKAKKQAPILLEAQEMLRKWEAGEKGTIQLWKKMNTWVLNGFNISYQKLGIDFDRIYFESQTYKKGKEIVLQGWGQNILFQKEDKSIWADLTRDGLDCKLLLRNDGTSVYMTQDIGTAVMRFEEYDLDKHIYVVGNEQEYHFNVLSLILKKLNFNWYNKISHLSYGMVELPEGKMKSREGTVVDADDLIDGMIGAAKEISEELGKLDKLTDSEAGKVYKAIALGGLKYFILKIAPKKTMLFNPKESIDFNGNTGAFIQYTYARIQSIIRKAEERNFSIPPIIDIDISIGIKEQELIQGIFAIEETIKEAGDNLSPALIANYTYELSKEYNHFYQEAPILKETDKNLQVFRLCLSMQVGKNIKNMMSLLGISMPKRM